MKKVLFISRCCFCDDKGGIDPAANHVSRLMIEGLLEQKKEDLSVVNLTCLKPWPKRGTKLIEKNGNVDEMGTLIRNVGFCNVIGIRRFSMICNLVTTIESILKQNKAEWVLCYSLTLPLLAALALIKNKYNVKICMIVPDLPLPQYMHPAGGGIYSTLKGIDVFMQKPLYKSVDKWILFSEYMNDFFKLDEKKWIVVEGMVDSKYVKPEKNGDTMDLSDDLSDEKVICYTGGVNFSYGIGELITEFTSLSGNYILQIIGSGDADEYVKEKSAEDSRIKQMGRMPHTSVFEYQKKADILINPREALDYTRYSFPSKILEYLVAGKPALMQRLPGIPKEYDKYLNYYVKGELKSCIEDLLMNYDESLKRAEDGKKFVLEEKNNIMQMGKVLEFIEG